jgi:transcriptional regulator with XRE-family HTH domain
MRGLSPETPEPLRRKQAEAVKTVGERLKASRELCNLSLSEAARRLGYSNPSKLSKVENATDTNSVPLWLIRDAAELYDVSTDYLFGLADDWETGIPRGMTGWLADRWEQLRRRDVAAMAALGARIDTCATLIPCLAADAREVLEAIRRLEALNPDSWPEIRGGSKLTAAAERLERSANAAAVAEKRLRIELDNATAEGAQ